MRAELWISQKASLGKQTNWCSRINIQRDEVSCHVFIEQLDSFLKNYVLKFHCL